MQTGGIQKGEAPWVVKLRLVFIHILTLGVFVVPYDISLLVLALLMYAVRTFAYEAGSHRYFAHHSYKTSRGFQLFLAILAASGSQRGPIWWTYYHRHHHRYTDAAGDPHSPVTHSFWYAHLGWLMDPDCLDTDLDAVKNLSKFPELVFINQYHYIFPYLVMLILYLAGEYSGVFPASVGGMAVVVWGFALPLTLSLHAVFAINSVTHARRGNIFSYRSYDLQDHSYNNWLLALPTFGASWHNNHHRYMNCARAGFRWYEIDITYYLLRLLQVFGVVWDIKEPPRELTRRPANKNSAAEAHLLKGFKSD